MLNRCKSNCPSCITAQYSCISEHSVKVAMTGSWSRDYGDWIYTKITLKLCDPSCQGATGKKLTLILAVDLLLNWIFVNFSNTPSPSGKQSHREQHFFAENRHRLSESISKRQQSGLREQQSAEVRQLCEREQEKTQLFVSHGYFRRLILGLVLVYGWFSAKVIFLVFFLYTLLWTEVKSTHICIMHKEMKQDLGPGSGRSLRKFLAKSKSH